MFLAFSWWIMCYYRISFTSFVSFSSFACIKTLMHIFALLQKKSWNSNLSFKYTIAKNLFSKNLNFHGQGLSSNHYTTQPLFLNASCSWQLKNKREKQHYKVIKVITFKALSKAAYILQYCISYIQSNLYQWTIQRHNFLFKATT